jgi:hypothetical protein
VKRRQASQARPAPGPAFTPDAFYERLIVMREDDPASVLRFGKDTMASLRAYEEVKRQAERTKKGEKK